MGIKILMQVKKIKVKSVKKVEHSGKVYDITMKSNPHTFFANDILVHNSCYFRLMEASNLKEAEEIGQQVVDVCDKGSVPRLVTDIFNGHDVMRSDFEAISRSTLSYGKKKQYAFLKAWEDGKVLPKPKLGITGLSIKRSDSPKQLSAEMKPFFTEIMKGLTHEQIKEEMDKIEGDYNNLPTYDLAAKRSANNLSKYLKAFNYELVKKDRPYNIEKLDDAVDEMSDEKVTISEEIYAEFMRKGKGNYAIERGELVKDVNGEIYVEAKVKMVVPFHIKASILYNYLLNENKLNDFNPILDGEKIKIFYIRPQKFNIKYTDPDGNYHDMIQEFDCVAFPSSSRKYPDFINEFTPNKQRMLETFFFGKLETIFDVIEFDKEKIENASMDALF
jgi:hypothetical protein